MAETTGQLVFILVVIARFLIPLTIPLYPLPGILASLILDGLDQTIFQQFPGLALEGYQGYDKALDIYYLTIAFTATLRNWSNHFAFQVSRFLFHWRLIGVVLFELMHQRPLLLIFPNTFEYFFIFYEFYRLVRNPQQMTQRFVLSSAAIIWIVIKLPQEYWLHIAQLDMTDFIKEKLFGAAVETPWTEVVAASPGVCLSLILVLGIIFIGGIWFLAKRLPRPSHALAFSADAHQPSFSRRLVRRAKVVEARQVVDTALVEKAVLVALICTIFAQILPGVVSTNLQVATGIVLVVIINTVVSHRLAKRGFGWAFSLWQSLVLLIVNASLFLVYGFLMMTMVEPIRFLNALFYVILLTLLITLYDRYRQVYIMRFKLGI